MQRLYVVTIRSFLEMLVKKSESPFISSADIEVIEKSIAFAKHSAVFIEHVFSPLLYGKFEQRLTESY